MGKLISFSDFPSYYKDLKNSAKNANGTILDTNILVSLTYEIKANYDEITNFLDEQIYANDIQCYTNVITTAEFINIFRRILLTENLADAVDESSSWKLSKASKTLIKTKYHYYKKMQETQGKDLIFSEGDLKKIRDTFSGVPHSGKDPWPELTKVFLGSSLKQAYLAYEGLGIKYISPNSPEQKHLFSEPLEFEDAIKISSSSGLAMFDSMILNALKSSTFSFAITADTDLAYATLVDDNIKDIVAPDSIVEKMKAYKFKLQ